MNTLPLNNLTVPSSLGSSEESPGLPENLYLFDERNRAFIEYRSTEIFPHSSRLIDALIRTILPALVLIFAALLLYLIVRSIVDDLHREHANNITAILDIVLIGGLVVVMVGTVLLSVRSFQRSQQELETLVRDGRVLFVPIEKCTLMHMRSVQPSFMRLRCSFVSPRSGRVITRSFRALWPSSNECLAVGTRIAILFLNYKIMRPL